MPAFFITATGTDIGKTFIASGLIRAARAQGRPAGAIKPVMSGYDAHHPARSDAGLLLASMGEPADARNVARISPWRYRAPLSPDMAAAREGEMVPFGDLLAFCRAEIAKAPGLILVEGVGGVMVPLDSRHTVRDWIEQLGLPVLLVAGTYLGTISHTLTAAEALLRRDGRIAAILLNESADSPVPPEETAAAISRFLPGIRLAIIPRDAGSEAFVAALRFFA
jgi:dethiobiotin synthetase